MKGEELILLFRQDKAYLTHDKPLNFSQVGLSTTVQSCNEVSWLIRVLSYNEAERKLFCEFLSCDLGCNDFPDNQKVLVDSLKKVEKVGFRNILDRDIFKTVKSFKSVSTNSTTKPPIIKQEEIKVIPVQMQELHERTITEEFSIPLADVRFQNGCVSFNKKFYYIAKAVEITIYNSDLIEEYDAIKSYFANILKAKNIHVNATVIFKGDEILSFTAKSEEIDKINSKLIENVKFELIKTALEKDDVDTDKKLYTIDEYFDAFVEEDFSANTFYDDEKEFLEDLLNISNTKHYKHLGFLSSKHCHQLIKLRFVHKPFSFVFLIEGKENYYFVWETLDTKEATYIWSVDKNAQILDALNKIEMIINSIKVNGKMNYINSKDDSFRRAFHDYSENVDGFAKWKDDLGDIMTLH